MLTRYLPFTVSTLWYLAGYLCGVAAFGWLAKRRGIRTTGVWILAYSALVGGLIGANAGQLLTGDSGKTILGGVIGGWITVLVAKSLLKLRRPTGDLFAFALAAGEAVGRWGCFFAGCCYGKPAAHLLWGVHQHDALRHPTQIYLSLCALCVFCLLLFLELRGHLPENTLFYLQGCLFAALRFGVEFFRAVPVVTFGLTTAQWVCLPLFLLFVTLLFRLHKKEPFHERIAIQPV